MFFVYQYDTNKDDQNQIECAFSKATYGCESWTISGSLKKKIRACAIRPGLNIEENLCL